MRNAVTPPLLQSDHRPGTATGCRPVYQYTGRHGDQTSLSYTYSNQYFSLNAQRVLRSADFGDSLHYKSSYRLSRRTDQLTGSIGLSRFGGFGRRLFRRARRHRPAHPAQPVVQPDAVAQYQPVRLGEPRIGGDGYSSQLQISIPFDGAPLTSVPPATPATAGANASATALEPAYAAVKAARQRLPPRQT